MEKIYSTESSKEAAMNSIAPLGKTALEILARPVEDYTTGDYVVTNNRPLQSTPTQERTWDQANNHPDSRPDIQQE